MEQEALIRTVIFSSVLVSLWIIETIKPNSHVNPAHPTKRLATNLLLGFISNTMTRLSIPLLAIGMATVIQEKQWGLFNQLPTPIGFEVIVTVMTLDFLIYLQHRVSHQWHFLWRLHQVHHTDLKIDCTTGVRFHPLEILLSMLYKMFCIILLGASVEAVLIFEILLSSCALFSHANIALRTHFEELLRLFIVTPNMHRIHHGIMPEQMNSNYGFCLSLWDKLFNSYHPPIQSQGHPKNPKIIGVSKHLNSPTHQLKWCLLLPFKKRL